MFLQTAITVILLGWAAHGLLKHRTALVAAALTMASVTGLAAVASAVELLPWEEGGWGMHVVALFGGYALGAAVGSRFTSSPTPRSAALTAAVLTLVAGAGLYWREVGVIQEVVQQSPADVRELILTNSMKEIVRLVQLAGGLALASLLIALTPRRKSAALISDVARAAV